LALIGAKRLSSDPNASEVAGLPIVRFQLDTNKYQELKETAERNLRMKRGAVSAFCRKVIVDNLPMYQPDVITIEPPKKTTAVASRAG